MIVSLRSDRVLADLDYCLSRGVETGAISATEWRQLFDAYRSVKLAQPVIVKIIDRIRTREREAAS
jgi:hypothetical protein